MLFIVFHQLSVNRCAFSQTPMDCLRSLGYRDPSQKLTLSDEEFEAFLQMLGVLFVQQVCFCSSGMTLTASRNKDGSGRRRYFRCKKRVCRKKVEFQAGTFFEKRILKSKEVFYLSYCWTQVCMRVHYQTALDMRRESGSTISSATIVSYFKAFQDVCVSYFNVHPVKSGKPNKFVEIDETVLARRKNNKGRLVSHQWCFGGIERGSHKCFIVAVEHRNAATLVQLVRQYILLGNTIMLDKWAAYNGIQELPKGHQHLTVNHKLHFIDPLSGACTNIIESL